MNKEEEIKCYICGKPTKFAYRPDIDMQGIPICNPEDNPDCMMKLNIEIMEDVKNNENI
jgi:hypothetical protein